MADLSKLTLPDDSVRNLKDAAARDSIATLNTKVGSATLTTTASDLSGAINEHETDITGITTDLGNETLPDTTKSVKGNINAINSSLTQKVEVAVLTANLTIDYADSSSIGYRTTETTKIDITNLTGYPTGKTYIGAVAQATDIYGTLVWIDNSKYLRGASKTSKTVGINVYVFYI